MHVHVCVHVNLQSTPNLLLFTQSVGIDISMIQCDYRRSNAPRFLIDPLTPCGHLYVGRVVKTGLASPLQYEGTCMHIVLHTFRSLL